MKTRTFVAGAVLLLLTGTGTLAQNNMPAPELINGKAIPASELPNGTITVRVVKESIGNNIAGQQVTVSVSGKTHTATTDEAGRAEFRDLPRGGEARAEAVVAGERLVSDPFAVPTTGGLRVILVANLAAAAERRKQEDAESLAAAPVKGVVVLGGGTRIVGDFQSDVLRFFYDLDIVNSARTRVDSGPFVLDLPRAAAGAELREGSPKSARIEGNRLTVEGPFNPGTTKVSVIFELRYSGHDYTFTQTWPVAVQEWMVAVERVNDVRVSSPQTPQMEERRTDDGTVFSVGSGAPMAAGSSLTLQLSNLPAQNRVASTIAVVVALSILGLGAWLAFAGRKVDAEARATLAERRETLLGKLEDLERSRRAGSISEERYTGRRDRLLRDLEQIYGELDAAGTTPRGGGEGIAA